MPAACLRWQDTACDAALPLDSLPPDDSAVWVRVGP